MSRITRIATPLMAVAIMSSAPFLAQAQNSLTGNKTETTMTQGANTPAVMDQTQPGYRDGMEAAKLDTLAKRKVDAKASHLYVHPPVKGKEATDAYRAAFESGYQAALSRASAS